MKRTDIGTRKDLNAEMNETMDTQDQVIGVRVRHATTTIANTVVGMTIIADTMSEMIANAQTGV
jgi:hypothetical protein